MDVTVNIRGNSQPFQDALDQVANMPDPAQRNQEPGRQPDNSRQPVLPPSDRLIDDMRREIEAQRNVGVSGSNKNLLDDLAKSQKELLDKNTTARFSDRRDEARTRMEADYEGIDQDLEERRRKGLQNLGKNANDPFYQSILDQQIEQERERRYRKVGSSYDEEFQSIDKEEIAERSKSENDLVEALRKLTEELSQSGDRGRDGTSSSSYMNQLREQRRQLLFERDNAPDEAGAADAQGRINEVDDQLRRVMNSGRSQQGQQTNDSVLQGGMGVTNLLSGFQGADLSSMIMGGGQAIAGFGGMSRLASLKFLGYTALAAAIAKISQSGADNYSKNYEGLGDLAALRGTTGGKSGEEGVMALQDALSDVNGMGSDGIGYTNLGIDPKEFATLATKRTKARGTSEDWYRETLYGVGMERSMGLESGSLTQGGQYDRYGQNVTDALAKMVDVLSSIEGSGVSANDFTRVQEKFDIQQQVMGSYMMRTDRPDYNNANNLLAAFSSTGVQQDARLGSDIQQFQDAIQNPMNERMKALVFSTVQDIMPETAGRMDLVDRAIRNPENEGKIIQAVVQRINQQFGGTDTNMGYWVFKTLFPNIAPDRLDKLVSDISNGKSGEMMKGGNLSGSAELSDRALKSKDNYLIEASGMTSNVSKAYSDLSELFKSTLFNVKIVTEKLIPPTTKRGGS